MEFAPRAFALVLLAMPLAAPAQPPVKVHRIGVLAVAPPTASTMPLRDAFTQGLREHGYVEGRNLLIEVRYSEGRPERMAEQAVELVRLRVDLIVAPLTLQARAALNATKMIPIVTVMGADPVATGLIGSLARPGGNVTGLTQQAPDLSAKQLQHLHEAVPGGARRVAVIWNPNNPGHPPSFGQLEVGARAMQIELQPLEARSPEEIDTALAALAQRSVNGLIVYDDPTAFIARRRIVEGAAQNRIPAIYGSRVYVDEGGLMSYSADLTDLFRRSARYIDKILKGAKPADLPVEQPTKFELAINLKTAKAIGLTIPQSILLRADRVIE
ncbi:MAG: ABC transporter substrate-binding protein [Burkholderiales bacterium]